MIIFTGHPYELLCPPRTVCDCLDKLDDIKDTTAALQYQQAIADLTSTQTEALNRWLAQLKPRTTHYTLDHAKIFNHTQQNVELVVDTACQFLASNHRIN
jgi:hypothetical protein